MSEHQLRGLHMEDAAAIMAEAGHRIRRGLGQNSSASISSGYSDCFDLVYQVLVAMPGSSLVLRLYRLAFRDWGIRLEWCVGSDRALLGTWVLLLPEEFSSCPPDNICIGCLRPASECSEPTQPVLLDPRQSSKQLASILAKTVLSEFESLYGASA